MLGNGDGTFQNPLFTYLGYAGFHDVAVGDVNGDGKPDVVVENSDAGGSVSVLLGNGDGTFQPPTTSYPTGDGTNEVALADLSGDGKLDIVAVNQSAGTISVLHGNGDGTFQQAVNYAAIQPNVLAVADLNGDGRLDIVSANAGTSLVSVLLNNGDGTFAPSVNYPAGYSVTVGDLTGDGKPDIVAGTANGVAVLPNNGDGTFGAAVNFNVGTGLFPNAVVDVNGDGKPEVIATDSETDTVWVLSNYSGGTFGSAITYPAGNFPTSEVITSASVADVNGDGRPDVVVDNLNSNNVSVLLNEPASIAGPAYVVDQDLGEQAALGLTVNGKSTTPIGAAGAGKVAFTVAGLDAEDTGTVTFTDANNKTVVVNVGGGQTSYTADLSSLADGTINSTLALSPDAAGNTFTPVSGNTMTLDQDRGEQAGLGLSVGGFGPVAFYGFDEGSGSIAHDQTGSHDGTISGATYTAGVTGDALDFTGSGLVSVPNSSDWNFGSGDFGIQFWVNFNSLPQAGVGFSNDRLIAHDEGPGTTNKWFIEAAAGNLDFHANGPSLGAQFVVTPFNPVVGQWYFIQLSKTGSSYQFSINGKAGPVETGPSTIPDANAALTIGEGEGGFSDAKIDDVAIFHHALTPTGAAGADKVGFSVSGLDPEDTGTVTFTDANNKTMVVNVTGGQSSYTADLSSLADGTISSALNLNPDLAGNTFTPVSGNTLTLDQDLGEQAALGLTVNGKSTTPVGAAGAGKVAFTVAGLEADDTGTVTFTDAKNNTVKVNVTGAPSSYTANLASLVDGTITSTLAVNPDTAGNTFVPVAGNSVSLDQDLGEQAALKLTLGTTTFNAANSSAIAFTVAGLDAEDTGTVTFTDARGFNYSSAVNGNQSSYTANLSGLADGTISSKLTVNPDAAGNTFQPVASPAATLTQFDHWTNTAGGSWATAASWNTWNSLHQVPTATIYADFDTTGTYTVSITNAASAYGLLLNDSGATVSDKSGSSLTLAGSNGSNGSLQISSGIFSLAGGGLTAGSIFIVPAGQLSVTASYAGITTPILDNGLITVAGNNIAVTFADNISGTGSIAVQTGAVATFTGTLGSEAVTVANSSKAIINTTNAVNGSGSFTLSNSASLEFASAVSENVNFNSTGTFTLDHSTTTGAFTGQLSGLSTKGKNQIDLADLTWVSGKMKASYSGTTAQGTLTVTNGTSSVAINLVGNYLGKTSWILSKDAGTGTFVKDPDVDGSLTPNANGGADGSLDFSDIAFGANTTVGYTPNSANSGGVLTVDDGASVHCVGLMGQYAATSFAAASDGHGGTVVTDSSSNQQPLLAQPHG